jgi:tetratricopeptide (TPR) repeat protein
VRPLLPGPGPHRVLVTSRHTLAGLGARLVDVTVLDLETAAGLLDAALRAARPGDDRISGDPGSAGRLAGLCGGLPLALQIAAALLKADPGFSAGELAADLAAEQGRLERLRYDDGRGPGVPSVGAAFGLSCARLDGTSARVFRLLPACPGPDVSADAARVLADLPAGQVHGVLQGLARAHLVEAAAGAAGRWRMHDLVRLYARQLSDADAEADGREQALDRLLGYYLDTADAADDHLRALPGMTVPAGFAGRDEALAWLDAERPGLLAAVSVAAGTGRDQIAMRLPLVLAEYLAWRRRFDDWLAVTAISISASRRLGDRGNEAAALTILGNALSEVRRFDEAITACQDAAVIYRETGDRHGEGTALNNLGLALREVRRFDEAITAHQDAAATYRETGDRHGEGTALNNLGLALREVRRFDEAITAHQQDLAIFRETGDRHGEGIALNNLGLALREVRRFDEAITAHQDAAVIYRETGDRHRQGTALNNLGLALREVRRFDEAITAHQDAAVIYRETGDRHGEGAALNNLGLALQGVRRFDEAITAHQQDLAICRETGDRHGEGMALGNLGLALREVRRFDEAITAHQDAAAIFRETGDEYGEGAALRDLESTRAARQA